MEHRLLDIAQRLAFGHVSAIDELSDNLLTRLSGFIDEIALVSNEILNYAGTPGIWKDLINDKGKGHLIKSGVKQLEHLSTELESLSKFIDKQYKDRNVANTIKNLVGSLIALSKSTNVVKKLFGGADGFVESLRERHEEVMTRVRACRLAIRHLEDKQARESLADFDFGSPE